MHPDCLQHSLTSQEAENFERDGYLIVPNALTTAQVDNYIELVDQLALDRVEETEADGRLHMRAFLRRDQAFLDLLDWPTTFPKMWGLMGWHLQLYLSHIDVTPPLTSVAGGGALAAQLPADGSVGRLGWHQDSGRVNMELETNPRPRLSTKIGYFL